MNYAQLLRLRETAQVPVPTDLLIDASPLQDKQKLKDAIAQQEKQMAEQEQRKLEGDMLEQAARAKLAESRAFADQGLGQERISRIQENEALATERYAEAQKDRALGELNVAKTLKELDDVDINQMEKLLKLALMMKAGEQVDRQQVSQRSAADQAAAEIKSNQPAKTTTNASSSGAVSSKVGSTGNKLGDVKPDTGNLMR